MEGGKLKFWVCKFQMSSPPHKHEKKEDFKQNMYTYGVQHLLVIDKLAGSKLIDANEKYDKDEKELVYPLTRDMDD